MSVPRGQKSGAVLFAALLLTFAACDAPTGGTELELDERTIQLDPGTEVHEVLLRVEDGRAALAPDTVRARPGDVIRFVATGAGGHAVVFDRGRLAPDVRAYLERTDQLRGPPLVHEGAGWIVSLEAAPAGRYPFICLPHHTRGLLRVVAERSGG